MYNIYIYLIKINIIFLWYEIVESPDSWIMASQKKPLINKFFNYLKTGACLSIEVVYPCLITLLDNLPSVVSFIAIFIIYI